MGLWTFLWARLGGENYYECERREKRQPHERVQAYAEGALSSRQNTGSIPKSRARAILGKAEALERAYRHGARQPELLDVVATLPGGQGDRR